MRLNVAQCSLSYPWSWRVFKVSKSAPFVLQVGRGVDKSGHVPYPQYAVGRLARGRAAGASPVYWHAPPLRKPTVPSMGSRIQWRSARPSWPPASMAASTCRHPLGAAGHKRRTCCPPPPPPSRHTDPPVQLPQTFTQHPVHHHLAPPRQRHSAHKQGRSPPPRPGCPCRCGLLQPPVRREGRCPGPVRSAGGPASGK